MSRVGGGMPVHDVALLLLHSDFSLLEGAALAMVSKEGLDVAMRPQRRILSGSVADNRSRIRPLQGFGCFKVTCIRLRATEL